MSSSSTENYYTCSHTHTAGKNLYSGTDKSDGATYLTSGGCYTKASTFTCSGKMNIVKQLSETSLPGYTCTHCKNKGWIKNSTSFAIQCIACGRAENVTVPATYAWCGYCGYYISEMNDSAFVATALKPLTEVTNKSCPQSRTKYSRSCGKVSGSKTFSRTVQTYKCNGCGVTSVLKLKASNTCTICGGTHTVEQSGASSTTHGASKNRLLCGFFDANKKYVLASALDTAKAVTVQNSSQENGENILIQTLGTGQNQRYYITDANGFYKIASVHSGKVLDVEGGINKNGANCQQYEWNGEDGQLWKLVKTSDGYFNVISKLGTLLDVTNGSSANNTNVQLWEPLSQNRQKWKIYEEN